LGALQKKGQITEVIWPFRFGYYWSISGSRAA
jgi:hypothetical protein